MGLPPNTEGVGARINLTADDITQIRELRAGNNFVSQNPVEAHFGLNESTLVDDFEIIWPDGKVTNLSDISSNQFLVINHPQLLQ